MRRILPVILAVMLLVTTTCCFAEQYISESVSFGSSLLVFEEPSTYCIKIPATIYQDETVTLTAEFVNVRDNEQVNIDVSNLDENHCITLTSEDGNTMKALYDGDTGHAGVFTNDCNLVSTTSFHFQSNGGNKAGSYSGTVEFTVSLGVKE